MREVVCQLYKYQKLANLGFSDSEFKGATFLNRVITLKDGKPRRLEVEADSRHAEIIVADLGLQNSKGIDAPAANLNAEQQMIDSKSPLLERERCEKFRSRPQRSK